MEVRVKRAAVGVLAEVLAAAVLEVGDDGGREELVLRCAGVAVVEGREEFVGRPHPEELRAGEDVVDVGKAVRHGVGVLRVAGTTTGRNEVLPEEHELERQLDGVGGGTGEVDLEPRLPFASVLRLPAQEGR